MVSSSETILQANGVAEPARISFSADFMDDDSFISISPGSSVDPEDEIDFGREMPKSIAADFEFLSGKNSLDGGSTTMLSADELFFEGKLLPCTARQQQVTHAAEKLASFALRPCSEEEKYLCVKLATEDGGPDPKAKPKANNDAAAAVLLGRDHQQQEPRIWFVDDDPSPRPPKCTVLWKELLRLKKQRGSSTLSPSSSTSSSSSSSSSSLGDAAAKEEKEKSDESGMSTREKHMRRLKRGLERTKSAASIRIRPMVNVPICAHTGKSNSLPPLFPLRKTKVERSK